MRFVLFSDQILDYLWTVSWQCMVLAIIIYIITRFVPGLSPRWKQAFWFLVYLRALVPAGLVLPTSLRQLIDSIAAGFQTQDSIAPTVSVMSSQAMQSPTISVSTSPTTTSMLDVLTPSMVLISLWLLGMTLMIVFQINGMFRLRKQLNLLTTPSTQLSERVAILCKDLGISKQVSIRLSDKKSSPYMTGLVHPVIVIPSDIISNCEEEQLEAILLHELTHLRFKDNWFAFFQSLIMIPFFFHPALWLASRFIREERELACDEAVLNSGRISRDAYASTLLALMKQGFQSPALSLPMATNHSKAAGRVHRILEYRNRSPKFVFPMVLVITCTSLFLTLEAQQLTVDQDSNESAVLLESAQSRTTKTLEVVTYQLLPANHTLTLSEAKEFKQTVFSMVETLLYSKEGKSAAKAEGRTILVSDDRENVTIIDYLDNQKKVREFLEGIGSVPLETGLKIHVQYLDHRIASRIVPELNDVISEVFEQGDVHVIPLGYTNTVLILYKNNNNFQTTLDFIEILDISQMMSSIKMVFLELTDDSSFQSSSIREDLENEKITFQKLEQWEAEGHIKLINAPSITTLMKEEAEFTITTQTFENKQGDGKIHNTLRATTKSMITPAGELEIDLTVETEKTKPSGAKSLSSVEITKILSLIDRKSPFVIQKYSHPSDHTAGYVIAQWTLIVN